MGYGISPKQNRRSDARSSLASPVSIVNRFARWRQRCVDWLPERNSPRKRSSPAAPQIIFRAVGLEDTEDGNESGYARQTVEVTLGPNATFRKGSVGRITRQVPADRLMPFTPPGRTRCKPKARRVPKNPTSPKKRRGSSGARFLRLAQKWQRQLDAGEIESQAAIARREGITRARVSQIMSLLRLAPAIKNQVASWDAHPTDQPLSERDLRAVAALRDRRHQLDAFRHVTAIHS